jgi:thioredoxin 2
MEVHLNECMGFTRLSRCPACGAQNRVPAAHLSDKGRCGACKADTLAPLQAPIDVESAVDFDEIVGSAKVPVLVDFWAEWCGPCRMAAPEVGKVAAEMGGKALVLKVDTESNPDLAARYRVQSIPNFLVFRNGRVALQQAGLVPGSQMRQWLS